MAIQNSCHLFTLLNVFCLCWWWNVLSQSGRSKDSKLKLGSNGISGCQEKRETLWHVLCCYKSCISPFARQKTVLLVNLWREFQRRLSSCYAPAWAQSCAVFSAIAYHIWIQFQFSRFLTVVTPFITNKGTGKEASAVQITIQGFLRPEHSRFDWFRLSGPEHHHRMLILVASIHMCYRWIRGHQIWIRMCSVNFHSWIFW
jgi:hypothetical protein